MQEGITLKIGDIVQIDPETQTNGAFGGCMLVVSEVRKEFVQGYVQALGEYGNIGGQAYIRLPYCEVEKVGRAAWVIHHSGDIND